MITVFKVVISVFLFVLLVIILKYGIDYEYKRVWGGVFSIVLLFFMLLRIIWDPTMIKKIAQSYFDK